MLSEISAMTLRKKLGDILNRVHLKHDTVLITRAEHPIAVLIDLDTYYQKINPALSNQRSIKAFANSVNVNMEGFQFNRDDANER